MITAPKTTIHIETLRSGLQYDMIILCVSKLAKALEAKQVQYQRQPSEDYDLPSYSQVVRQDNYIFEKIVPSSSETVHFVSDTRKYRVTNIKLERELLTCRQ